MLEPTPRSDYYIIRGVVFQAPDLASVLNNRLLNAIHFVRKAFDEANSRTKIASGKSTTFNFLEPQQPEGPAKSSTKSKQADIDCPPTAFQKRHVDVAIADLVRRFPPATNQGQSAGGANKPVSSASQEQQQSTTQQSHSNVLGSSSQANAK